VLKQAEGVGQSQSMAWSGVVGFVDYWDNSGVSGSYWRHDRGVGLGWGAAEPAGNSSPSGVGLGLLRSNGKAAGALRLLACTGRQSSEISMAPPGRRRL